MNVPARPRPRALQRVALYGALLLALAGGAAWLQPSPQRDLDRLVGVVSRAERGMFFHDGSAAIGFHIDRGWTLTIYVGDVARFAPADFLVLRRLDGRLDGELLVHGRDAMIATALQGAALDAYLERSGLDLTGLDALHQRRVAAAGK